MTATQCAPENCPIVTFSDLTRAEQKVERGRKAAELYGRGFTMEHIAGQFGVTVQTISNDLVDFPTNGKSKPAKTASNPKGAGRPKGSGRTRRPLRRSRGRGVTVERASTRMATDLKDLDVKGPDRNDFRGMIGDFVDRLIGVDVGLARELLRIIVNADANGRNYLAQMLQVGIELVEHHASHERA
jgi:hypothetical protein